MSNIITHIDFKDFRTISKKYDIDKVESSITQAHTDLMEVLGSAFYFDVIKKQADTAYVDLMEGSEFLKGEFTLQHAGLKALVSDYTYARYLYEINTTQTPFGMVSKSSNDSTPVDRNMIKDLVHQAQKDAVSKWELIRDYLNANKETFTVWSKQQDTGSINDGGGSFNEPKFTFISSNK